MIFVEGEFDCLLLQQILGDRASVLTFGGVADSLNTHFMDFTHLPDLRYIALDNDRAGESAAAKWLPLFQRVKPPCEDWTTSVCQGFDLLKGWTHILDSGNPFCDWEVDETLSEADDSDEPDNSIRIEDVFSALFKTDTAEPVVVSSPDTSEPPAVVSSPDISEPPVVVSSPDTSEDAQEGEELVPEEFPSIDSVMCVEVVPEGAGEGYVPRECTLLEIFSNAGSRLSWKTLNRNAGG